MGGQFRGSHTLLLVRGDHSREDGERWVDLGYLLKVDLADIKDVGDGTGLKKDSQPPGS